MARRKTAAKITVRPVDDLTEQEAGAYGALYVATVGDFTSARRTTEARAIGEAEAHLATLAAAETDDGAEEDE